MGGPTASLGVPDSHGRCGLVLAGCPSMFLPVLPPGQLPQAATGGASAKLSLPAEQFLVSVVSSQLFALWNLAQVPCGRRDTGTAS